MSEYGNVKGVDVDCKAMEAEGAMKGQGMCAMVLSTCRVVGAGAVMWSESAESEAKASLRLTMAPPQTEPSPSHY